MAGSAAANRAGLGRLGERLAAEYLERRGYTIVERNFHWRFGEIDLVARRDGWLVFVEVRTRRGDAFGDPAESLTRGKQERLRVTAEHYCQRYPAADLDWRIDLVAIRFDRRGRLIEIEQYENVIGG